MIERSEPSTDFVVDTALNSETVPTGEILVAQANTVPTTATDATENQANLVVQVEDGSVLRLPEGTSIDAPRMNGANLEFVQPDGSVVVVPNGAIEGLTIVLGGVEIPPLTVAALFAASDIQTAAGPAGAGAQSSGGNFEVPVGDIGTAFNYGDLLDGTELPTSEVTDEEIFDNNLAPRFALSINEVRLSEEGLEGGNPDSDGNTDTTDNPVYSGSLNASDPNGDPLTFRFGQPATPVSSQGVELTWTGVGTSVLSGWAGETLVVQAVVSGNAGAFTVTLFQPVDHPAGAGENEFRFDLPITATDGRGGSASSVIRIIVEDDSPTVDVTVRTGEGSSDLVISLDETVGGDRHNGEGDVGSNDNSDDFAGTLGVVRTSYEGGLAALFDVSGGYGADGGGSTSKVFSFAGIPAGGLATSLSATNGGLITLFLVDGVIVGRDAANHTVFKIEIIGEPGAEQLQTTLLEAIAHHGEGNQFDEQALLQLIGEGAVQLKFEVTRTDFDGDTITDSATIDLVTSNSSVISFEDDGPKVNDGFLVRMTVDEDDIATLASQGTSPNDGNGDGSYTESPTNNARGPATVSGSLAGAVSFGSDGAAAGGGFSISSDAVTYFSGLGLSSKGDDLSFSVTSGKLTATAGDGRVVFEFSVKPNGDYDFRLYDQLDHDKPSSGSDQNTDLQDTVSGDVTWLDFGGAVRATDGDGDWIDLGGKLEIRIRDDVPELVRGRQESVTVDEDDIDTRWSEGTSPSRWSEGSGDDSRTGQNGAATVEGSLANLVRSGADESLTFSFRSASFVANALESLGLTSGGNALEYEIRDGVLYAYVDPRGPNNDHVVFKLTLESDGDYKFELFDQLDHDAVQGPNFGLEDGLWRGDVDAINFGKLILATDHDGDSISLDGAFEIRVRDDVPELVRGASVSGTVEEEALPGGNEDRSASPDIDEDTQSNSRATDYVVRGSGSNSLASLVETGADEDGAFAFKSGIRNDRILTTDGAKVYSDGDLVSVDKVTSGQDSGGRFQLLTAEASDGRDVFTLKVYEDGDWEFKLLAQLDHQFGDNKEGFLTLNLSGLLKFTDADGDVVNLDNAKFTVRVIDDMPEITLASTGKAVTIDETGGNNDDNKSNISALFSGIAHPTDPHMAAVYARDDLVDTTVRGGADDIVAQSLKLQIDNPNTGLFTTEGKPITLVQDGAFILGKAGGLTAFAIHIDASGQVSIAQYLSLKNPNTSDHDDRINLSGKISAVYSVTDHDGDKVTKSLQIGGSIQFDDDGPRLGNVAAQTIAELTANGASNAFTSTTLSNVSLNVTWGADGPNAQNLSFTTKAGVADFTSNGQTVTYSVNGTLLTASAGTGGSVREIFTVRLNSDGSYNFTLKDNIDHPAGSNSKELTFGFKATDGDGDSVSGSFKVNVTDTVPTIGTTETETVSEQNLPYFGLHELAPDGANSLVQPGKLNIDWNADDNNSGIIANRSVAFAGVPAPTDLTSDGKTVVYAYTSNGTVLTATAGGEVIFTVSLNDADTGSYTFRLFGNIDHAVGADSTPLSFGFVATDADGDTASSSFTVNLLDDQLSLGSVGIRYVEEEALPHGNEDASPIGVELAGVLANGGLIGSQVGSSLNISWGNDDFNSAINGGYNGTQVMGDRSVVFASGSGADRVLLASEVSAMVSASGGNGNATLTSNGQPLVYTLSANGTVLTASAGGHDVFRVTLSDQSNGSYSFKLLGTLDHPIAASGAQNEDVLSLRFNFTARDGDGDQGSGNFVVRVIDDSPEIGSIATLDVSEKTLDTFQNTFIPQAPEKVSLNIDWGADGAKTDGLVFTTDPGPVTGLFSNGIQVAYSIVGNVLTASAGAREVFTVTLNSDGTYSFVLKDNIDHASGSNSKLLSFGFQASDADNDTASGNFSVNIKDSVPTLLPGQADVGTLTEGTLPGVSSTFGDLKVDINADDKNTHVEIAKDGNGNYILPQGLTSDGVALDYVVRSTNGGDQEIVAFKHGQSVDQPVFIVAVVRPGSFAATLFQNLDHAAGSDTLAINLTARVYDGDGDYVDRAFTVNVKDTVPELLAGNADVGTLVEGTLPSVSSTFGSLKIDLNADDKNTHVEIAKDGNGNYILPQGLTSDGVALDYLVRTTNGVDQEIVAFKHGETADQPVFIVAVVRPGGFAATLFQNLDHAPGSDTLPINLTARVYDGDGDYVDRPFVINVLDDEPTKKHDYRYVTVSDSDLANGPDVGSTVFQNTFGADGLKSTSFTGQMKFNIGGGVEGNVTLNIADGQPHTVAQLKSGGQAITFIRVDATTIIGSINGGTEVIRLELGGTDQSVKVTLSEPIDHIAVKDGQPIEQIFVDATVAFTDGDGDTITAIIRATVTDDVPKLNIPTGDFNLLTNGDFSAGTWTDASWDGGFAKDAVGWKITGTEPGQSSVQLEYVDNGYFGMTTTSGKPMVDLGSSPGNVAISQSLSGLTIGQSYTLTFKMGSPDPASSKLEVYWNGNLIPSPVTTGSMELVTVNGLFPDINGKGVLTFKEVGNVDYTGTYLADVGLAPTGAVDLPLISGVMDEDGTATVNLGAHFSFGEDGAGKVTVNPATVVITTPTGTVLGQPTITVDPVTGVLHVNPGWGFNGLSQGEIATLTIPYTVTDADGDSKTGLYQLTINGQNDQVSTSVGFPDSGTITEYAEDAPNAGSGDVRTEFDAPAGYAGYNGGGFWIYDDQGDTHSVTVMPGSNSGYLGTLVASVSEETAGDGNGFVTWLYKVSDAALNPLQAGEQKVETFTIRVSDGHGSFADRVITVTLVGTNDTPVISVADGDIDHVVLNETNAGLQAEGTLSVVDVDVKDVVTVTVTGASATGLGANFTDAQLKAFFSVNSGAVIDGTHTSGDINWAFDSGNEAFNFLKAGDAAQIKYTVQVSDGHGGFDSHDVVIDINGTNDRPVVDLNGPGFAYDVSVSAVEQLPQYILTEATLSDVDSTDLHSMTITLRDRPDGAFESISLNTAADALRVGATLGLSYDHDTGVLKITGQASIETYQAILRGVTYLNSSDNPVATGHTVAVSVNDGAANSVAHTAKITVIPLNDAPVLAGSLNSTVAEGGTVTLTAAELGYKDPDNSASEVVFRVSALNGGEIRNNGVPAISFTAAELASGIIKFVHNGSENATAGFVVEVEDGNQDGSTPTPKPFVIDVTPVNDAPTLQPVAPVQYVDTAVNDTFLNQSGQLVGADPDPTDTLTYGIQGGVAGNHTVGGATFDVSKVGAYGTLHLNSASGAYIHVPNDGAIEALNANTQEVFTVTVSDGHAAPVSQVLAVTITAVPEAPVGPPTVVETASAARYALANDALAIANNQPNKIAFDATTLFAGSGLTYSVEQVYSTGNKSWSWMHAANSTTFSGNPENGQAGLYVAKVTATNSEGSAITYVAFHVLGSQTDGSTYANVVNGNSIPQSWLDNLITVDPAANFSAQVSAGDDGYDVMVGNGFDNNLNGGSKDDMLLGGGGDDTLYGGAQRDYLNGGAGNDTLYAGTDGDWLDGGEGNDILHGSSVNDILIGGAGDDTIYGNGGLDWMDGGSGNDTLYGGSIKDTILGGAGDDKLYGYLGDDILSGGAGNDLLVGGNGSDTLTGGAGADVFVPNAPYQGVDTITDYVIGEGDTIDLSELLNGALVDNSNIQNFVRVIDAGAGATAVQINTNGSGHNWDFVTVVNLANGATSISATIDNDPNYTINRI